MKNKEINILILSAGRRVELVQCFQKAAKNLNINGRIVAADCSDLAPALYFADRSCQLPRISDPSYINSIIDVCKREEIALIVPTIDTDLLLLAKNKKSIESTTNAKVLISDEKVIAICRDKILTQKFLEDNGFFIPKMYTEAELDGELDYPLFIKPKSGSSSIHTYKVNNQDELDLYRKIIGDYIIQDYIQGEEYTVDAFLDFEGHVITIVPRIRLATRSGEIAKGRIVKDRQIIDNVRELLEILKPIGQITVQLMKTAKGIEYIEVNPRFGGGSIMSIQSGADSCQNLYNLLSGQQLDYNEDYRENLTFLRFDNSICLDENGKLVDND